MNVSNIANSVIGFMMNVAGTPLSVGLPAPVNPRDYPSHVSNQELVQAYMQGIGFAAIPAGFGGMAYFFGTQAVQEIKDRQVFKAITCVTGAVLFSAATVATIPTALEAFSELNQLQMGYNLERGYYHGRLTGQQ